MAERDPEYYSRKAGAFLIGGGALSLVSSVYSFLVDRISNVTYARMFLWGAFLLVLGVLLSSSPHKLPGKGRRWEVIPAPGAVPAVNAHTGSLQPKHDWECFRIHVNPAGSYGQFSPIWAMASASTISFISAELCERLGGVY